MPALVNLMKGIGTNAASLRNTSHDFSMTLLDSANILAGTSPIGRPATGFSYSYESWLCLQVETAPENGLTNFRFWSSGNNPATGIEMYVGTAWNGVTPTVSSSISTDTTAAYYNSPGNSLLFYNNTLKSVGDKTAWLVMQLRVGPTAPTGTLRNSDCCYNYSYDEC
jgi:hypothetical protein